VAKAGGAGNAATLAAALRYHTMGWSLVPLLPGGGKKPDATVLRQVHGSPKWGQLRRRRATEADIRAWFEAKPDIGIGVILGASSGGLVVLDVDKVKAFMAWSKDHGLAIPATWTVRSGRGWHYYFRAARRQQKAEAGWGHLLGDGQIVALPPSRHEEGGSYKWSLEPGSGDLAPLTEVYLVALTSSSHPRVQTRRGVAPIPTPRGSLHAVMGTPPLDGRRSLEELQADPDAARACVRVLGLGDSLGDLRCPFHGDQAPSASLNAQGDGFYRLTCHSGSCELGGRPPRQKSLGLGELLASRVAGWKVVHLDGYEVALWNANVMAVAGQLGLPQLEVGDEWDLSETRLRVLNGFHWHARIKRWLHGAEAHPTPWTRDFAARWCGVTPDEARNANEYLEAIGELVVEERRRLTGLGYAAKLYRLPAVRAVPAAWPAASERQAERSPRAYPRALDRHPT